MTPLSGRGWNARVNGGDETLPMAQRMTFLNAIGPGWFETYGIRLLGGRDVSAEDVKGGEQVAVVNETFVKRFIGSAPPIGHEVQLSGPGGRITRYRVIGVSNDVIYRSVRIGVPPTMYVPLAQVDSLSASFPLTLQVAGDRDGIVAGLKAALARTDPNLAFSFRDYADQIAATISQERLVAMLSGFFGGLALAAGGARTLWFDVVLSHSPPVGDRGPDSARRRCARRRPSRAQPGRRAHPHRHRDRHRSHDLGDEVRRHAALPARSAGSSHHRGGDRHPGGRRPGCRMAPGAAGRRD